MIRKDGSEGGQRTGMFRVNLRRLGKRFLRTGQVIPPHVKHAEKVKDVRVVGCERGSGVQMFLSVAELILLKCF